MFVVNTISVKFNRGRVAALYFFKKYKYFLQLRGHAAMIKVELSFICCHVPTVPQSENFEIATPQRMGYL